MTALEEVLKALDNARKLNIDPTQGRLFTYIYETGVDEIRKIIRKAFEYFAETNALDPMVFRSAFLFEKEVIAFAKDLVNADDEVVGTVTYGGTESIMLAVKAAREYFRKRKGLNEIPEVLLPITGHPSIRKAAHYLNMRTVDVPIDSESKKVNVEALKDKVNYKTALVVVSAPNFPYGTIDPVKDVAEYARDKGVPVHVDSCLGGYILPFMKELGEPVPSFGFEIEGVMSLSMDTHKYGYAPKGVSVLLFRSGEYKEETIYVDLRWPGYPFINNIVLSSRSIAPLAAAWAIMKYLGKKGYLELTGRLLRARDRILKGLMDIGFKSIAPIESPLLSLTLNSEEELFKFYANMTLKGWVMGLQPRIEGIASYNIHLTLSPIHKKVVNEFLKDARESLESPSPKELIEIYNVLKSNTLEAASMVGKSSLDSILIAKLLESMPKGVAEDLARKLTVEVYR